MEELYNQVIEAVHGQVKVKTPFGEFNGIGPDAWIEKAFEGRQVTGWQILAIVLFCFGIPSRPISKDDEIKLFYKWKLELDAAVRGGLIHPYDHVTLLRIKSKPKDYNWVVPIEAADIFMGSVGHDTKVSSILEKLHKEYLAKINSSPDPEKPTEQEELNAEKPLSKREHTTYLNIIGALLELHGQKDAATIDAMIEKYPTAQGLKKRTLEGKFAEARRSLKST